MRSFLAYHFIQINLILELYIAETDILFDVIQAAKVGLIHPSLLTPQELLKQFLNIKVGMPSGTDLPIDLNESNVQEMIPLSDITIYYSNDKIVFILNIPLVYQYELTLFQLIPIPDCNDNNCIYTKPSYKYLAEANLKKCIPSMMKSIKVFVNMAAISLYVLKFTLVVVIWGVWLHFFRGTKKV
ncbi:Envelope fusion protein [Aphis craccivora]|uniref:Envelope fusion protein n=1 Tax=Aphis craccivora TaxID=307492 RepID=A0A6G0XZI8_APHCR|nr:Envelope fusion protein [Aphis craccivora]